MKICTFYGVTYRLHPLFLLMLAVYILAGQGIMIAAYLLALILHESGHFYIAAKERLPVSMVEFTPFGGAMQISLSDGLAGRKGVLLASAGMIVNLICAVCTLILLRRAASSFLNWFLLANLSMLAINLLPVLPLDGGRILLSLLAPRLGRPRAFRKLLTLGRILAGGMMAYGLGLAIWGIYQPAWMLLGCYLLYAASLEEKHGTARYLSALFSRRFKIDSGTAIPVQHLCVDANMPLFALLPQLQPNAYHMITVVDDTACKMQGTLNEEQLFQAVMNTPSVTVKEIL